MKSSLIRRIWLLSLAGMLVLVISSTAGSPKTKPVRLQANKPTLTAVEGYEAEQTKGDIAIRCIPVPFADMVVYHQTLKEKPKGLISIQSGTSKTYLVTQEPMAFAFDPNRLTFQLRFANNTNHVLRFSECLLSLMIDNQQIDIDSKAEEQLRKTVILPHGTGELTVLGPQVQAGQIGDSTKTVLDTAKVVMFSIYDVTTEVDEANNPTKKATFEWIFENKPVALERSVDAVTTEQKLEPADAQKMHNQWYVE